jgi:hypothetical protein
MGTQWYWTGLGPASVGAELRSERVSRGSISASNDVRFAMTTEIPCKVRDALVNELLLLNNKLNTLSPGLLHSEEARVKVQERREALQAEIKQHRKTGHQGKPCPAVQRFVANRYPRPAA